MRPSQLSYTFLLSFLFAIFLLQWWQRSSYPLIIWILLGFFGLLACLGFFLKRTQTLAPFLLAITLGSAIALLSVARTTYRPNPDSIERYAKGENVIVRGSIVDILQPYEYEERYVINAEFITLSDKSKHPVDGNVLLPDRRREHHYRIGDVIEAQGLLHKTIERPGDPKTRFLEQARIFTTIKKPAITLLEQKSTTDLLGALSHLREKVETRISLLYPEPHASLLIGLLTGSRTSLPKHLKDDFQTTGLTHIIAISGYNITMVIAIVSGFFFWLPKKWRFAPCVLLIILFTLFVGASASVVRAAIMGILGLIALQTERMTSARLTILWAMFCMIIIKPSYLWYDAGFQLSFLAVLGLLEITPILQNLAKNIPEAFGVRDAILTTLAVEVMALPWVAFLFGKISLIAPIANVLVAPCIPFAMLFGAMSVLASTIMEPLGQLIAAIAWITLHAIITVAESLAKVPAAAVDTGSLPVMLVAGYYAGLSLFLFGRHRRITTHTTAAPSRLLSTGRE